jgi:hypothetical protein
MHTKTVIHKISAKYRVIEYQLIENNEIIEVFFKASDSDNNEFGEKYDEISDAIAYINNITFK